MPNSIFATNNMSTVTCGGGAGLTTVGGAGVYTTNGASSSQYVFANSANTTWNNNITSTGPIIAPDFVMDGVSLKDTFEKINERLSILVPDPSKMEKFAALKAAYEHYKLLEKLCTEP